MLFDYSPSRSWSPERLQEIIEIAGDFGILRHDSESDEEYAERALRITRLSAEIPKLFSDKTWDTGSVIDAVTLGLASIVATNYQGQDAKTIDSVVTVLLSDRIKEYRRIDGQEPAPIWSDDDIRNLIKKFQLVDRPVGGKESDKLEYARRTLKALKMTESALVAADCTDFDAIEALCLELSVIFGKSPLPVDIIQELIKRIPENAEQFRKDKDDGEEII
jgi:hypothetical protein